MVATIVMSSAWPPRFTHRVDATFTAARTPRAIIKPYARSCSGPRWMAPSDGLGMEANMRPSSHRYRPPDGRPDRDRVARHRRRDAGPRHRHVRLGALGQPRRPRGRAVAAGRTATGPRRE